MPKSNKFVIVSTWLGRSSINNEKLENDILSLPDGLVARYLRLTDLMIEFGANLGLPHTKAVTKGLFELRVKSREGIVRVFFCTKVGKKIIMLHSYVKKSQKTPKKELKIATTRMNKVRKDETF